MRAQRKLGRLPLRHLPDVSVDAPAYRKGFSDGFVAPRSAVEPRGRSREYLAGWLDGFGGVQVPAWRLEAQVL